MQSRQNLLRWLVTLTGVVALTAAAMATADPPSRVARLAYFEGNVSFSPAGDDQWVAAAVNRPLIVGDRLWSDTGSRAELQMTNASLRFGPLTSVTILNLDDRTQQLQLTQGVLHLQVRRLAANEIIEIDTPNFAFSVTRPGSFRFEVDPQSGGTLIAVRAGEGEAYGDGATYRITVGQAFRFYGTDLRDQEYLALPAIDGFERWSLARAGRYERVVAARYVAPEVIGYEDLDDYGTWRAVANYGNVWSPRSVPSGWAPYRNGHWAWIDPWGWTWIDDAPWGFAPFHYGRWAQLEDRWCWVPGPVRARPVYAPALVAFVGGAGFSISATSGASIGWFPLAPGEVYRPAYSTSRDYFTRINVTNTVVNNTYVTNIYNNRDTATNIRYANMQRPAAITAVPQAAFVQGQPVQRATLSVTPQVLNRAQVLPLATIAPQPVSIRGAAPEARARPPAAALEKPVVAKAPPPPAPVMPALNAAPGRPMERPSDNAGRRVPAAPGSPAPSAVAPPPNVRVVQAVPAKPAPTVTTANAPGRPGRPGQGEANAPRNAGPGAPALTGVPPGATARPESPPEPRGERGRRDMTPAPQAPAAVPAAPEARPSGRPMAAPERPATVAPATPPPAAVAPPQPPAVAAPRQPTDEGRLRGNERRGREAQPAPPQPPPAPMARPEARPLPPQPAPPPAAAAPPQPPAVAAPPQPTDEGRLRGNERRGREAQPAPPQPPPAPMARPEARPPQASPPPQAAPIPRPAPQAAPAPPPQAAPIPRPAPQAAPAPPPQAAPIPRPAPQAAPAPPPESRPAPAAATPPAPPPQVQQGKGKGEEKRDNKRDEKDKEQK